MPFNGHEVYPLVMLGIELISAFCTLIATCIASVLVYKVLLKDRTLLVTVIIITFSSQYTFVFLYTEMLIYFTSNFTGMCLLYNIHYQHNLLTHHFKL